MSKNIGEQNAALQLDRAEFELRRGQGLLLSKGSEKLAFLFPMEFMNADLWERYKQPISRLLAHDGEISITAQTLQELADAIYGGPMSSSPFTLPASAEIITLTKQAGILPLLMVLPASLAPESALAIDIQSLIEQPPMELIQGAAVTLPIKDAPNSVLISFRTHYGSSVHLALCIGDWQKQASPLVRAHSSCVTGDILGSLRCDCGDQLHLALDLMKKEGSGILLYLHQEGRGIGISSKLRAYKLQEQGLDTFAANTQLGYHEDERDFSIASAMLSMLGVSRVRLLTNNPEKLAFFKKSGIIITQRIPLIAGAGEHNANYIDAKTKKHGHLF